MTWLGNDKSCSGQEREKEREEKEMLRKRATMPHLEELLLEILLVEFSEFPAQVSAHTINAMQRTLLLCTVQDPPCLYFQDDPPLLLNESSRSTFYGQQNKDFSKHNIRQAINAIKLDGEP